MPTLTEQTFEVYQDGLGTIELTAELSSASPELIAYVTENREYLDGIRGTIDTDMQVLLDYIQSDEGGIFIGNSAYNKNFGTAAGTVSEGNHTHAYLPLSGGTLSGTLTLEDTLLGAGNITLTKDTPYMTLNGVSGSTPKYVIKNDGVSTFAIQSNSTFTVFQRFNTAGGDSRLTMYETYSEFSHELRGVDGADNDNALMTKSYIDASSAGVQANVAAEAVTRASADASNVTAIALVQTNLDDYETSNDANTGVITGRLDGHDTAIAAKEPSFTKSTAFNKDFGTLAGTVTQGNDARLSDARTPTAHTHVEASITDLDKYTQSEVDAAIGTRATTVHTHVEASITDLDKYTQAEVDAVIGTRAPTVHTHLKAQITDFSDTDYAAAGHTHTKADITDFSDTDYAAAVHAHTKAAITDFSDADYATAAQGALADTALQSISDVDLIDLGDVDNTMVPLDGQVLTYNAGVWDAETSPVGVTDHGLLSGLSDDDHDIYHTDARGDVRYNTKAEVSAQLATKEPSFTKNTAFNKDFGTAAGTVTQGDDARLSDARTPTSHTHSEYVDLSNDQIIAGIKTFSAAAHVIGDLTLGDGTANNSNPWLYINSPLTGNPKVVLQREGIDKCEITGLVNRLELKQESTMLELFGADGFARFSTVVRAATPVNGTDLTTKDWVEGLATNYATAAQGTLASNAIANALPSAQVLIGNGSNTATPVTLSGDVTTTNAGVTSVGNNKITLAKLAQMSTSRILGRTTAATGNVESLTPAQARSVIGVEIGTDVHPYNAALIGTTGTYTGGDASKLANIQDDATANSTDTVLKNRANHTGTQPLASISDAGSIASKGFWMGTQAQYDALGVWNANTIYFVTA